MSPFLLHDVRYKAQQAERLPSVEQWLEQGGRIERIEQPSVEDFKPRETPRWGWVPFS